MKFKVGDLVRPTRETIIDYIENGEFYKLEYYNEFQIIKIDGIKVFYGNKDGEYYTEKELELVHKEPEFEYGELIEVRLDEGAPWVKRPFIYFEKGNAKYPYITANITKKQFDEGKKFDFQAFKNARKLKAELSRREIAEKFGVAEDFRLLD